MATRIKNTDTGEIVELECLSNGIDFLADVLGGCGIDSDEDGWLLDERDIAWWTQWCEREERITDAYKQADKATRTECEQAVIEFGHDYDTLQDVQEEILGIERD